MAVACNSVVGEREFTYLVGHGSSGTKRVFHLLDLSPLTNCRMSYQAAPGSPFEGLANEWIASPANDERLERGWDSAVEWAAHHLTIHDHLPPPTKFHLHEWARRARLWKVMTSPRLRWLLNLLVSRGPAGEWPVPGWLGDASAMAAAHLVLKHNQVPAWASWVLRSRPSARVLHVVRHPGGYLHAWIQRYLSRNAPEAVLATNAERLRQIARNDDHWGRRFGDIEAMTVDESELWFWRFTTESIHSVGRSSARYLLVRDEAVVNDPESSARELFRFVGLPWSDRVSDWIERQNEDWRAHSRPWKELLEPPHVRAVQRVLDGSTMQSWWSTEQRVSLCDYVAFELHR